MFGTIKSLIPEPRQADQPRRYVGRHRHPDLAHEPAPEPAPAPDIETVPDEEPVAAGMERHTA
jgi:hypothetical protein